MTEHLLQFIWLHRLYNTQIPLLTTDGESVLVLHTGQHNTHAGPDFSEAKLKIGNTTWCGNIEVHINSSDWNKHAHQTNEQYEKLILHVVFEDDSSITTMHNTHFPTLALKQYIDKKMLTQYQLLMSNQGFIPCDKNLHTAKAITIQWQLERMLAERLEEKTNSIQDLLTRYNNNWQEVFYVQLARGFGLHINQDAFELVALQTPLAVLAKHRHNPLQVEALLFGQAGFLREYFDEVYPLLLQKEYEYLQKLHSLHAIEKKQWKFLRLRPANFPTLRLAQLSQLICNSTHLFSKITEANSLKEIEHLFKVKVSDYWLNHFTFSDKSAVRTKSLGKTFIHSLIINAIIPTLFIYGKLQGKQTYCDKAIRFLEEMPPEKNSIISNFHTLGFDTPDAASTQSLLQLYKKYCTQKQCLHCSIGYEILKK